jgi:DNA/RNA endonuclease YhcR with UshA esterase domain
VIVRYLILLIIPVLFVFSSCGKEDKQQEYVDEKSPVTESPKEEVKKTDSVPPVKTESKDSVKKDITSKNYEEKPVAVISPLEAAEYMGKPVTVKGFVADVYKSDKVAYLNFVKKYPDNPFTGVIFAGKFDEFGDIMQYENRNVEITGRVSTFRGKPQMILDRKSQIKISE